MKLGNCARGDHEECIATILPERIRECECRCHRQAMAVEHRPTARDVRVRSRSKNWQGSKWYVNAFPKAPQEAIDEAMACEHRELTKEEAWQKFMNETRL